MEYANFYFTVNQETYKGSTFLSKKIPSQDTIDKGDKFLVLYCEKSPSRSNIMIFNIPLQDSTQLNQVDRSKIKINILDI